MDRAHLLELRHAVSCLAQTGEFDVISDHTGLLGLALGSLGPTPFAHTVHGPLSGEPGVLYEQVVSMAPRAALISVSDEQRRPKPELPVGRHLPPTPSTCPSTPSGPSAANTSSSSVG